MQQQGRVVAVEYRRRGSELAASASAGATTLTVEDAGDFAEDGGQVLLNGTGVATYTAVDDDAGTLTLAAGLGAAYSAGDRVDVYPEATEHIAHVQPEDEGEDVILARIPHSLVDLLPEGVRDQGEAVLIEEGDAGDWAVVDVTAQDPRPVVRLGAEFGDSRFEDDVVTLKELVASVQTPTVRDSLTNEGSGATHGASWAAAQPGDYAVYMVTARKSSGTGAPTLTLPTGFTLLHSLTDGDIRTLWAYKKITGSQPQNVGVSVTESQSLEWIAGLVTIQGLRGWSVVDHGAGGAAGGTSTSQTITGLTTAQADELWLALFAVDGPEAPSVPTTGFSNVLQETYEQVSGKGVGFRLGMKVVTAKATLQASSTTGTARRWTKAAVALYSSTQADPPAPDTDYLNVYAKASGILVAQRADGGQWNTPLFATIAQNLSTQSDTNPDNNQDFQITVVPNATYLVEALILYNSHQSADLKYRFGAPAGSAMTGGVWAYGGAASSPSDDRQRRVTNLLANEIDGGLGAGGQEVLLVKGVLRTADAGGTFDFRWSQNTSHATPLTIFADSYVRLDRVV